MTRSALFAACFGTVFSGMAASQEVCPHLIRVVAAADTAFDTLDLADAAPLVLQGETCSLPRDHTGLHSLYCRWGFDLRAPEAQAVFDLLVTQSLGCFAPDGGATADQPVNHPDFYALEEFSLPRARLAISLKDKAALGQSFVFLRVTPN